MITNRKQNEMQLANSKTEQETNLLNTKQNKMSKLRQSIIDKYKARIIEPDEYGLCVADSNLIFKIRAVRVSLDIEFSVDNLVSSLNSVLDDLVNRATFKNSNYHMRGLSAEEQQDWVQIVAITLCELKGIERYYDEIVNILQVVCDVHSVNSFFTYIKNAVDFDFADVDKYVAISKKYLIVPFKEGFISYTKLRYLDEEEEYLSLDYVRENRIEVHKFLIFKKFARNEGLTVAESYEYFKRIVAIHGLSEEEISYDILLFNLIDTRPSSNYGLSRLIVDNKIPVEAFESILSAIEITEKEFKTDSSFYTINGSINDYLYQNVIQIEFCIEKGKPMFKLSNSYNDVVNYIRFRKDGTASPSCCKSDVYSYHNRDTAKYYRVVFIDYWNSNYPLWKIDKEFFLAKDYKFYVDNLFKVIVSLIKYPKLSIFYNVFKVVSFTDTFLGNFLNNSIINMYNEFDYEKTNPREMLGISKHAYKIVKNVHDTKYMRIADIILYFDNIIEFGFSHAVVEGAINKGNQILQVSACSFFQNYIELYEEFFEGVISKKVYFNYVNKIMNESYLHGGGYRISITISNSYYSFLNTYRDYIKMCKDMNITPVVIKYNEKVKFPELNEETGEMELVVMDKLKKYHDDLVKVYTVKEEEWINEAIVKLLKKHSKLKRISVDGFSLMLAPDSASIVHEGQELSHCISSYIKDYASEKVLIAFFRSDDNLKAPLYTMEIKIIKGKYKNMQFKGYKNRRPLKEHIAIADKMIDIANS